MVQRKRSMVLLMCILRDVGSFDSDPIIDPEEYEKTDPPVC